MFLSDLYLPQRPGNLKTCLLDGVTLFLDEIVSIIAVWLLAPEIQGQIDFL
jgi:hypothetical protein